ncbi:MAG: cyclic nucleotide-binding domain-containing protein, partial [Desulfatiglandales bacterium]
MLEKIINNPDLDKYRTTFETDHIIFHEGDNTQDLYILVSGQLDVLKGKKSIAEISAPGSLFGEMSFLLGAKRTATVKARNEVKAIRIPKKEITVFLSESPTAARDITKLLAERLDETSQILYGLKEFCDQLPDAVILTDTEEKILTWNSAAEKLYGRNGHQMRYTPVEKIYQEPQVYKNFLEEVQSGNAVKEKILRIRHPEKGTRFISTSMTLLYDDNHNFHGVISLGRDITSVTNLERGYRRARYWLVRSFFLLGLLGLMAVTIFFGY